MIQKRLLTILIAALPILFSACDDDDDDLIGLWTRVSDLDGLARSDASSFTIGNKGYIVCGFQGDNKDRLKDLWEYDMNGGYWTQKASLPDEASARNSAVAFAINDKGYLGTGYNPDEGNSGYLADFWEYNPSTNQWSKKADFPGTARYGAVGFSVGGKGYIGAGYDGNYLKDFFEYNPNSNTWVQINSSINKRQSATSFVIDDVAYVVCGINNGTYLDEFWKFDPSEGWSRLRDIANNSDEDYDDDYNIVGYNRVAFVIDGCAYVTCGESGGVRSDTWKYYPSTDLWENVAKFKGTARTVAVSFSNGSKGYVATGRNGTYRFDDIWTLDPYTYDDDDY